MQTPKSGEARRSFAEGLVSRLSPASRENKAALILDPIGGEDGQIFGSGQKVLALRCMRYLKNTYGTCDLWFTYVM